MQALPVLVLEKVAKDLEQHENAVRIKKMIFCICKNKWENDKTKLDSLDFKKLIQELVQKNPTLENLKISLYQIVKTLNKPGEYTLVAKVIFTNVGQLYPEMQKSQPFIPIRENEATATLQYSPQAVKISRPPQLRKAYDPFDMRVAVMNYVNPLRAKIVLYSALDHIFDFSKQDWVALRSHELDDLLQRLFKSCKNFDQFEDKLRSTARSLAQPEEHTQVADAIIRLIKPFYTTDQSEGIVTNVLGNSKFTPDDEDNTCQFLPS